MYFSIMKLNKNLDTKKIDLCKTYCVIFNHIIQLFKTVFKETVLFFHILKHC